MAYVWWTSSAGCWFDDAQIRLENVHHSRERCRVRKPKMAWRLTGLIYIVRSKTGKDLFKWNKQACKMSAAACCWPFPDSLSFGDSAAPIMPLESLPMSSHVHCIAVINGEKATLETPTFAQKRQRTLDMLIRSLYQDLMPDMHKVNSSAPAN